MGVAAHAHAGARRASGGVVLALGAPEEREEEAGLDELVAEDGGAERGHQQVEAEAVWSWGVVKVGVGKMGGEHGRRRGGASIEPHILPFNHPRTR